MERVLGDNTVPGYRTLILYPLAFPPGRAPEVIQELYGTLHLSTVVGVNRTVRTSGPPGPAGEIAADATLALMELQLQKGSIDGLHAAFCQCIDAWCEARHPQLTMEWAVKRVFQQLSGGGRLVFEDQVDLLVEDAFFSATTTGELRENLWDILSKALPRDTSAGLKIDSPAFFRKLQEYVESHLAEPRVAQSLCASFGLSQSYLSKLFRAHGPLLQRIPHRPPHGPGKAAAPGKPGHAGAGGGRPGGVQRPVLFQPPVPRGYRGEPVGVYGLAGAWLLAAAK